MFYLFTALLVATTVAAANTTTTNSSRTIHPVNNTNPQLRKEGATRNIYRCVYVYISESDHSWPGNGDVCLRGGQNVCNYDPTLPPVGQCQLNRGRISSQLVTNATNFWMSLLGDTVSMAVLAMAPGSVLLGEAMSMAYAMALALAQRRTRDSRWLPKVDQFA